MYYHYYLWLSCVSTTHLMVVINKNSFLSLHLAMDLDTLHLPQSTSLCTGLRVLEGILVWKCTDSSNDAKTTGNNNNNKN